MNPRLLKGEHAPRLLLFVMLLGWCAALLLFRFVRSGSLTLGFLAWNLFLAAVPAVAAWLFARAMGKNSSTVERVAWFVIWLLFLPNAPYIITDFVHLTPRPGVPFWYDIALLVSCAGTGLLLGYTSIADVQVVVARRYSALMGWLLVVGTIPAGILGLLFEHALRKAFASPGLAAAFLTVNGVLLLAFERLRKRAPRPGDYLGDSDARLSELSWRQAVAVGTSQAAALIPGISRSGVTMGGGLLVGLSNEDAARYAFLLATPIIGAAALLKLPDLFGADAAGIRGPALVGALCAAATTYLAVKFLLRFFQTNRLTPFGIYCIAAGLICTVIFAFS